MKKRLHTKIIAGKYKGKKIELPDLGVTRSSKSILRESLFNILQFDIVDRNFVEVFGGSGSVGLEALSRGAKEVYFIEKNRHSYEILQKNAKSLDMSRCKIFFGDAFEKLFDIIAILKRKKEKAFFYFDPPFSVREGYEDIYERVIDTIKKIPKEVSEGVIVEHMSSYDFPQKIGPYTLVKKRKYGKSSLTFYQ